MNRKFYEAALLRIRSKAVAAYGEVEAILKNPESVGSEQDAVDLISEKMHELLINENAAAALENYFGQVVASATTNSSLLLPEAQRFSILLEKLDVLISQTLPLVEKTTELTPERSANLRSANRKQKIVDDAKKKQRARKQKEEESGD